jgi:3-isopropylmalate/(R)-2-methylmalate dehydratase small subunit
MEKFTKLEGVAAPLKMINVDTDMIIPADYLKTLKRTGLAKGLFSRIRKRADGSMDPDFALNKPAYKNAQILVAGDNFGCGSSREHAPWALVAWGIRAVITTSCADIFRGNALKNGLLPIVVEHERHRQLFELVARDPDVELTVDLASQVVHLPGEEDLPFDVDPFSKLMLLEGTDELGYLLDKHDAIAAWEATHPARIDTTTPA